MMRNVRNIDWDDLTESVPAFLTAMVMPFAFSITEGIAWGFISYALLKLVAGEGAGGTSHTLLIRHAVHFQVHLVANHIKRRPEYGFRRLSRMFS